MRIFKCGDWKNSKRLCPVCNSGKDGEVVLITIDNTIKGNIAEAIPVHLDCLDLFYNEEAKIVYQQFKSIEETKQEEEEKNDNS